MTRVLVADRKMSAGKMVGEFGRELVVGNVLARLVVLYGVVQWKDAVRLGIREWIGFPAMRLVRAAMWNDGRVMLAAIRAADWFVKTLLMAAILGVWPR